MWPTAKYDLPRARQEASRPAATAAMITGPNPAFSRRLTWQISDAALTAATGASEAMLATLSPRCTRC